MSRRLFTVLVVGGVTVWTLAIVGLAYVIGWLS